MTSPASNPIQVRVENLARYYANLARTLTDAGIGGSELNAILSTHFRARCVQCDIPLASNEIEQVSLADDAAQLAHPKLKRLRLGYCAREGCESYEYRIYLEECSGVDWEKIAARTNDLLTAETIMAKEETRRRTEQLRNQKRRRTASSILIILLLCLLVFVWRNGRLSIGNKPQKYQIDPASAPSAPRR